jgi:Na+/melibiose symporter-like transporter
LQRLGKPCATGGQNTVQVNLSVSHSVSSEIVRSDYILGVFLFGQGSSDFVTTLIIYFLAVVLRQSGAIHIHNVRCTCLTIIGNVFISNHSKEDFQKVPNIPGISDSYDRYIFAMIFFAYAQAPILPIFIASFISGLGTAASSVTSYAILTDLTDVDYLITTKRRRRNLLRYGYLQSQNRERIGNMAYWTLVSIFSNMMQALQYQAMSQSME